MGLLAVHLLLILALAGIAFYQLRRRGGFIDRRNSIDMVRFYDSESRQVVRMPRRELTDLIVEAHVPGVVGIVWVDPREMPAGAVRVSQSDRPAAW